jgi:hypothetical protein
LLFRQLLALPVALRLQQFAQQALIFVLLRQRTIQLLGQIDNNLPQRLRMLFGSMAIVRPDYAENGSIPSKNNRKPKRFMSPRTDTACAASPCSNRCRSAALVTPAL